MASFAMLVPVGLAGTSPAMTHAQHQCEQTESQWFRRLVLFFSFDDK